MTSSVCNRRRLPGRWKSLDSNSQVRFPIAVKDCTPDNTVQLRQINFEYEGKGFNGNAELTLNVDLADLLLETIDGIMRPRGRRPKLMYYVNLGRSPPRLECCDHVGALNTGFGRGKFLRLFTFDSAIHDGKEDITGLFDVKIAPRFYKLPLLQELNDSAYYSSS